MTFLMRYSEHHDGNRYALNIWNYITGTLISFFMLEDKTLVLHSDLLSVISGILNGSALWPPSFLSSSASAGTARR